MFYSSFNPKMDYSKIDDRDVQGEIRVCYQPSDVKVCCINLLGQKSDIYLREKVWSSSLTST